MHRFGRDAVIISSVTSTLLLLLSSFPARSSFIPEVILAVAHLPGIPIYRIIKPLELPPGYTPEMEFMQKP